MARSVRGFRTLPQSIRNGIQRLLSDGEGAPDDAGVASMEALLPRTPAEIRARQLLIRVLSPSQREEFGRHGYFTVQVPGWGTFRVLPRTTFNVVDTQTGICYCAVPEISVPLLDLMLAQKLILENDPERFFRVAHSRREE